VGLSKKYQGKVRGNPEDNEVIRAFVGTYSPAIYAYYSSYASAAIREEKRSHTVFKSARVAIGIAAGLFAIGLMVWRPWSSLSATSRHSAVGSTPVPSTTVGRQSRLRQSAQPIGNVSVGTATPTPPKRPCAFSAARE
jgi:zona occludens toxin